MFLDTLEDGDEFPMNCLMSMLDLPRYRVEAGELPRVAVLRPQVASPCHVTASGYSHGADQRITQMSDLCLKC
jgi:hypothetical protein